ncbi:hypothetical protein NDU88_008964 [Pleurodeles waltl]|uniref:Uncharacterized protein n=1 Tax=Pleurodeles waltl TaxID=8319 RepID=A0AAV7P6K9_PLEWA|nr:hypothetical protein NDU88_008964 [Pleurodeles waltl]
MATSHDTEAVRAALRILVEAGRADLLRRGVLDQAWVGMSRPTRAASSRVAAVIAACESQDSDGDKEEASGAPGQEPGVRSGTPNAHSPLMFSGEAQGTQDPGPGDAGAGSAAAVAGPPARKRGKYAGKPRGGAMRPKAAPRQARLAKHKTTEEVGAMGAPVLFTQGTWDQAETWDLEARIREQRRIVVETEARWAQLCKNREEAGTRSEAFKRAREAIDNKGTQPSGAGVGTWVWVPQSEAGREQEAGAAEGQVGVGNPGGAYGHGGRS